MSGLVKLGAIGLFWYGLLTTQFHFWLWELILWEIGSGFKSSTLLWISGWKR